MGKDPTFEQIVLELEQTRRELREIKARYASSPDHPSPEHSGSEHPAVAQDGKRIEYSTDHLHIYTNPTMNRGEPRIRGSAMLDQVDADQMKNSYRHLGEFKSINAAPH